MTTATLAAIAHATGADEDNIIDFVLQRIDDEDERQQFLRGLGDRLILTERHPSDETVTGLSRWVGSWLMSFALSKDELFLAADLDADRLVATNQLGNGITASDLRARYSR